MNKNDDECIGPKINVENMILNNNIIAVANPLKVYFMLNEIL